jgi:hypothetical protein
MQAVGQCFQKCSQVDAKIQGIHLSIEEGILICPEKRKKWCQQIEKY